MCLWARHIFCAMGCSIADPILCWGGVPLEAITRTYISNAQKMTACSLHIDLNKMLEPHRPLIELSEPNRSDKDTVRSAAGNSIVPARNRAEPNTLRKEKEKRRCTGGGGCRSMSHSKDLGASYVVYVLLPVSVCVCACVRVFEGLTALPFSSNYLRVGTTANPTRPSYGNTFLPPVLSPSANYV